MIVECKIVKEVEKVKNKFLDSKNENSMGSEFDEFSNLDSQLNMNANNISIIKGGFNIHDEFTFKILMEFVKKRVEIITSKKDALIRRNTGRNLINLIGDIMKVSTLTL